MADLHDEQVALADDTDYERTIACTCAGSLVGTNAHEDTCEISEQRWNDPEYVSLWEQRNRPGKAGGDDA